jgi:hypothetical protein
MATKNINELDFSTIKSNIKTFLSSQEQFKDYNFDGSNLSVLLDVFAYNSFLNNYYGNMLFSEMFLDSAQKYSSVVSHAKELNYLPRSIKSSKATINFEITDDTIISNEYVIPKGTKFQTTYNGSTFVFVTRRTYIASRVGTSSVFSVKCMDIYEGTYVTEIAQIADGEYGVSVANKDIDTDTITVSVENDYGNGYDNYTYKSDIYGSLSTDKCFYLEIGLGGYYSVQFGRDVYGVQPTSGKNIQMTYMVSTGVAADGSYSFKCTSISGASITTVSAADGAADMETISEIKFNAPKSLQTQERAVSTNDYVNLLKQRFQQIAAVSVFGGDELDPPRYGKVAISVNLNNSAKASDSLKNEITNYLASKIPIGLKPVFVDPGYIYASMNITVYYNSNISTMTSKQISNATVSAIISYGDELDNTFGSYIQPSSLTPLITSIGDEIIGSSIELNPIIMFSPEYDIAITPTFIFNAALKVPYKFNSSSNFSNYIPAIKSSEFTYNNSNSFFMDDGLGNIHILSADTSVISILKENIGTVDYNTGTVKLSGFITSYYDGDGINIYANTINKNLFAPKTRILKFRENDITVTVNDINNT